MELGPSGMRAIIVLLLLLSVPFSDGSTLTVTQTPPALITVTAMAKLPGSTFTAYWAEIAIDLDPTTGYPVILLQDAQGGVLARQVGVEWPTLRVPGAPYDVAVGADGIIHTVSRDQDALLYARIEVNSVTLDRMEIPNRDARIRLDPSGTPYILAWRSGGEVALGQLLSEGWTWQDVPVRATISAELAFLADGTPVVATYWHNPRQHQLAQRDAEGSWHTEIMPLPCDETIIGMAIDRSDVVHVACASRASNAVFHAQREHGTWTTETVTPGGLGLASPYIGATTAQIEALALSPDGRPHLLFKTGWFSCTTAATSFQLHYAIRLDQGWFIQPVEKAHRTTSCNPTGYSDLVVGPDGAAHIAYAPHADPLEAARYVTTTTHLAMKLGELMVRGPNGNVTIGPDADDDGLPEDITIGSDNYGPRPGDRREGTPIVIGADPDDGDRDAPVEHLPTTIPAPIPTGEFWIGPDEDGDKLPKEVRVGGRQLTIKEDGSPEWGDRQDVTVRVDPSDADSQDWVFASGQAYYTIEYTWPERRVVSCPVHDLVLHDGAPPTDDQFRDWIRFVTIDRHLSCPDSIPIALDGRGRTPKATVSHYGYNCPKDQCRDGQDFAGYHSDRCSYSQLIVRYQPGDLVTLDLWEIDACNTAKQTWHIVGYMKIDRRVENVP